MDVPLNSRCTNTACRRTTLPTWSFCASCGEDLRMPGHRHPVSLCETCVIADGEHCIECGQSILDQAEYEEQDEYLKLKVYGAWAGMIVGGLVFGFGQTIMIAREGGNVPFGDALRAWAGTRKPGFEQEVTAGLRASAMCVRVGSLMVIASLVALIFLPSLKKRRQLA